MGETWGVKGDITPLLRPKALNLTKGGILMSYLPEIKDAEPCPVFTGPAAAYCVKRNDF